MKRNNNMAKKTMVGSYLIADQYQEAENAKTQSLPCLKLEQSSFMSEYIVLNETMQLVWDKKQWIIQTLAGGRLRNRSFCATRSGLLRALGSNYPNKLTNSAVYLIKLFPEYFSEWRK